MKKLFLIFEQSMERERCGTAQSPVFAIGKNGPIKIVLPNIMTVCICS